MKNLKQNLISAKKKMISVQLVIEEKFNEEAISDAGSRVHINVNNKHANYEEKYFRNFLISFATNHFSECIH